MARNPNRMQEATDLLMGKFKAVAAVTISYRRGATTISNISATPGRTPFEVLEGSVMVAYESRDFIVERTDLASLYPPLSGDVITADDGRVYEVSMPVPLHVYESIGPQSTVTKIHTRAVG